jgi:hypothetical protein
MGAAEELEDKPIEFFGLAHVHHMIGAVEDDRS